MLGWLKRWKAPKPHHDEILWKLVCLAEGDTELANAAIRQSRVGDTSNLGDVVAAILRMKQERRA